MILKHAIHGFLPPALLCHTCFSKFRFRFSFSVLFLHSVNTVTVVYIVFIYRDSRGVFNIAVPTIAPGWLLCLSLSLTVWSHLLESSSINSTFLILCESTHLRSLCHSSSNVNRAQLNRLWVTFSLLVFSSTVLALLVLGASNFVKFTGWFFGLLSKLTQFLVSLSSSLHCFLTIFADFDKGRRV